MNILKPRLIFSGISIALLLAANCARANDQFWIFDGPEIRTGTSPTQKANEYGFDYSKSLDDMFSVSIGYGNEGHFNQGVEHHRDYDDAKLWAYTDLLNHQLTLAAGFGPAFYYDTTGGVYQHSTQDVHGFGTVSTATATINTFSPFLFQLRANYVNAGGFNTASLMLGIGYQFDSKDSSHSCLSYQSDDRFNDTKNEVTVYGGKSVINLSGNGHADSFGIEYRHDLSSHWQWSTGLLDEGKSQLADRFGVTNQLWLTQSLFDNRLSIGAAGGLYLAHDSARPNDNTFVTPMGAITAAFQVTPEITVRMIWDRIITNYNRDADVGMLGIGYRF